MDCTKDTKSKQEESFLPPLSPSSNQPDSSSSRQSSRLHSRLTVRSSLSSHSVNSAQSRGSALEEKRKEAKSAASSINSETLAIAVELTKLKERRDKDERETLARILDNSNHFGSSLVGPSNMTTPKPQSKTTSPQNTKTPPATRVYTGPGAHFLDWYVPNHWTGSRALQRSTSASIRNKIICSPLHKPEKQEWTDKLIDPKASGLRIPTAVPPRIVDYPCTWQNSFKEELKKYQMRVDLQNSKKSAQLKSLPQKAKTEFPIDTTDNKLNGSMFVKTQVAPMPWFIVHPDWRNEPKITWNDLESSKYKFTE